MEELLPHLIPELASIVLEYTRLAGVCVAILTDHTDSVWYVCELKDGRLASCSKDCTIRAWQGTECTAVLKGHTDGVQCICELKDGRLVSCGSDGTIRIWY